MTRYARPALVLVCLLGILSFGAACGTGGTSGDDDLDNCIPPFSDNLTGTWVVEQTWFANECSFVGPSQSFLTTTQNDNQLTFFGQGVATATICGSRAQSNSSFSYLTGGGTMTVSRFTIQFSSETAATGSSSWNWRISQGAETCSGTSTFTLQR